MITISTSDYLSDLDGRQPVTRKLQELIDLASQKRAKLIVDPGIYLTSSLFLKSHMQLELSEGAVLLATTDESTYPLLFNRVAGIEMDWYPALLNLIDAEDVQITGRGVIDGNGPYWWEKYWGTDGHGGMRQSYDSKGLRWACDYDCMRLRNLLVMRSKRIQIQGITSANAGFWNVHLLYSQEITIDGIQVDSYHPNSPSTDGIDIDSCQNICIRNCTIQTNDDSICIKSGRDSDGKRVGLASKKIRIEDCHLYRGFGLTIGSEVSGGIEDVWISDIDFHGTDCGIRIKSSQERGGFIRKVHIQRLKMENVRYLFHFYLNWNPNYSKCLLPPDYRGPIPKHWEKLLSASDDEKTKVSQIWIKEVSAFFDPSVTKVSRLFHLVGYEDLPMKQLYFENLDVRCLEYGIVRYVDDILMDRVQISIEGKRQPEYDEYDVR